jgi:hypothetical protein
MTLTDADRRAYAERQAYIRKITGRDDRAATADPIAWMAAVDAEAEQDNLAELLELVNAPPLPTHEELVAEAIAELDGRPRT